jgi:hypothetical protein
MVLVWTTLHLLGATKVFSYFNILEYFKSNKYVYIYFYLYYQQSIILTYVACTDEIVNYVIGNKLS